MKTERLTKKELAKAVNWIKDGEVVAFPTETVYGLGADATNEEAVQKIFQAKGRPADNPLIIHVASVEQAEQYVTCFPEEAKRVVSNFWPGACTLVLNKKGDIASSVTADLNTIAIRMPNHPLALELIEQAGVPLAAPSANSSGKPSPTTADHVYKDLNGKIRGIIDGGATGVGLESTVLDMTDPKKPTILRPGGVTSEQLETVLGKVYHEKTSDSELFAPKSPGMKYRHYSPDKPVYILPENLEQAEKLIGALEDKKECVGLLVSEDTFESLGSLSSNHFLLGRKGYPEEAANRLYEGLRKLDESDATVILAEAYDKTGIGRAYMNRLEKAAEWLK
ncbi:L-threonylcarbamoyladenylate synthase [Alkalibacterium sp.]|nr:MAG: threonylcarbamoyl-AMP synthase [Alkalibacterium sp.]